MFTQYAIEQMKKALLEGKTLYAGLATAVSTDRQSVTEVTYEGYVRQLVALGPITAEPSTNTNVFEFPFMPAGASLLHVTHLALFDAVTGGHLLEVFRLLDGEQAASFPLGPNNRVSFGAGTLVMGALAADDNGCA